MSDTTPVAPGAKPPPTADRPGSPSSTWLAFAGALAGAALLTGVILVSSSGAPLIGIAALLLAATSAAAVVRGARRRSAGWLLLAVPSSVATLGLLARDVGGRGADGLMVPHAYFAALVGWGAVLLAGTLCVLRITDAGRALMLACSLAFALVAAESALPWTLGPQGTRWEVQIVPDSVLGYRYVPHSVARNFYPDNPRRYFEQGDPWKDSWSLETHDGSLAQFTPVAGAPRTMRVTVDHVTGPDRWLVKLAQAPFRVEKNRTYVARFRARASAARAIGCAIGQNHAPWQLVAKYVKVPVGTQWRDLECRFGADRSEGDVRLFFDVGGAEGGVELTKVELVDASDGRALAPRLAVTSYVTYRFDSLGFRGPDRQIPAPDSVFRILALGDSYTLGVGVREGDTFTARLEDVLNRAGSSRPGLRYEVVNGGVSGYDTRQERLSYERVSKRYGPRLVLVAMVFNDDMSSTEEAAAGFLTPTGPFKLVNSIEQLWRPRRKWDYTRSVRELIALRDSCRTRNQRVAVVIFRNSRIQPWPKLVATVRDGLAGTGIPMLDLGPALLASVRDERELIVHPTDGHPNELAHRVAAEAIAAFLRSNGLLPD